MTTIEAMTYDFIVEFGIATADELNLARNLMDGPWMDVLNRVVYIRTGYQTYDDWLDAELEEED